MNIIKPILLLISRLFIVLIVIWIIYIFAINIQAASSNVISSLIGAVAMLIAGIIAHNYQNKREIVSRQYPDKREVYTKLIELIYSAIETEKNKNEDENEGEKLKKSITDFSKSLLIFGSPEMIKAWNDFTKSEPKSKETKAALETIETLLKAVRKDLGHNDSALKDFEITNVMLTPEARI